MSDASGQNAAIVAGCEIGAANHAAGAAYNDHTRWSGGVAGQLYIVTNRNTTSGGRTDERSFVVQVQER